MTDSPAEKNIALVEDFLDALGRFDFERLEALATEDIVFTIPFGPAEFTAHVQGRDEWFAVVRGWSEQLNGTENLHDLRVDALSSTPDELVSFYSSDMEMKNGYHYTNAYIGRFVVRDGRVARFDEYFDSLPFVRSLGGTVTVPGSGQA